MKRSDFTEILNQINRLEFRLPSGEQVPDHFHITEAGITTKQFIDCGGTLRTERTISFQIWTADDTEHRLNPSRLLKIMKIAEPILGSENLAIRFEYQKDTLGIYGVEWNSQEGFFQLTAQQTDCLAKEQCGVTNVESEPTAAAAESSCCTPGGECC
ncbi:MAG: DUF6428 family protein [Balneolaceae bacterium]